jgi:DNA-binding transcriptional ArsR family regulator
MWARIRSVEWSGDGRPDRAAATRLIAPPAGRTESRLAAIATGQTIADIGYHHDVAMNHEECVTASIAAGMTPAVALFRSLGDETRLRIVRRLAAGEARVVDLTGELGMAQSTVSKHLACLRDCGLVDYRTQGRQSFYALTRPELMDLLAAAEGVLAATGSAVTLCPTYGAPDAPAVAG